MLNFLIVAQLARAAVVWTTHYTAKKILKTIIPLAVGGYLVKRAQKQNQINARRELRTDD